MLSCWYFWCWWWLWLWSVICSVSLRNHCKPRQQEVVTLWGRARAQLSGSNSQKCSEESHRVHPGLSCRVMLLMLRPLGNYSLYQQPRTEEDAGQEASQSNTIRWVSLWAPCSPLTPGFEGHGVAWAVNRAEVQRNQRTKILSLPTDVSRDCGGRDWGGNKEERNPPKQRLLISMLAAWTKPAKVLKLSRSVNP